MFYDPIGEQHDPMLEVEKSHNETLQDMKEQLLEAINNRKSKVLSITLNMFNKLQEKSLKTIKLNTVENLKENKVEAQEI